MAIMANGEWIGASPEATRGPRRPLTTRYGVAIAPFFSQLHHEAVCRGWPTGWPRARAIDIGSASHFVAVPPDRDDAPVREFSSFTIDLNVLADWLKACGVDTVAMESTGV